MVLAHLQLTDRDLVETLGISVGSVSHILDEVLGLRKLCATITNDVAKTQTDETSTTAF